MKKVFIISVFVLLLPINLLAQWQRNLVPYNTQCFTISEDKIFVGTEGSGILMSSDSGSTWIKRNIGLPIAKNGWVHKINSLFVHDNIIYAGLVDEGIYYSNDYGNNWEDISSGLPETITVNSIVKLDNTLFVGTDKGTYSLLSGNKIWQEKNTGLTNTNVISILNSDNNLFAGTNGGGILISTNSGDSWSEINNGISNLNISSLAISANTIYAGTENGIYSSSDNGVNWNTTSNGLINLKIKDIVSKGDKIFTIAGDSIYFSSDSGTNWILKNDPYWNFQLEHNQDISAIGTSENHTFIFRNEGMVHKTENDGDFWITLNLAGSYVQRIVGDENIIYAGTNSDGIFVSKDKGVKWKSVNNGISAGSIIRDIASDSIKVLVCTNNGIYKSIDEGENWYKVSDFFADRITISGTNIYAARNNIYLSIDSGNTWNIVSNNLPYGQIWSLASQEDTIYAGTANNNGLYKSIDGGKNWENIFPEFAVWSIDINGNNIYFCTQGHGVYRSQNYGNTWEQINNGLPSLYTNSIEKSENILIADGYLSTDNGNNWKDTKSPGNLDVEITENFIFTCGSGGVWRLPIPVLLVDDHGISFYDPNIPGSATFNIISTTDWTITKSQDWLSCNTYSGSGHALITVNDSINPFSYTRIDTLIISSDGAIPQNVIVRHYGQYLELSDDTITIEAEANSTQSFEIYSSLDWNITCNQSWLTISNNVGNGEATIVLTATENPSANPRNATVTISGTGIDDQIITIIQNGGTTNISNIKDKEISVYPNPSNKILIIEGISTQSIVKIFSVDGEQLKTFILSNKSQEINVSQLKSGIYILKIETPKGVFIKKFIKE